MLLCPLPSREILPGRQNRSATPDANIDFRVDGDGPATVGLDSGEAAKGKNASGLRHEHKQKGTLHAISCQAGSPLVESRFGVGTRSKKGWKESVAVVRFQRDYSDTVDGA